MTENAQLIEEALETLKAIKQEYRAEPIAYFAVLMSEQIRPTMAFDSAIEERRQVYENTPREFTEAAAKVAAKRAPNYQTQVFKCLGDFEKCKKSASSELACRAVLVICIGKHLVPFVRQE